MNCVKGDEKLKKIIIEDEEEEEIILVKKKEKKYIELAPKRAHNNYHIYCEFNGITIVFKNPEYYNNKVCSWKVSNNKLGFLTLEEKNKLKEYGISSYN